MNEALSNQLPATLLSRSSDLCRTLEFTSEQGEREGEAPSGFAGGGGDASPYKQNRSNKK